ncbi:sec-independent protein translocase protein TatB [Allopseudospirillum japonicum]|uniref:Sec-independent protein translocase protein TatB n=1 Tax=Allopseudospirillum japonicum TaxID=64971 RepID=A0A1H6R739_9GAMM|nr:Sec-independent protein translocase protein TatB [Allopseudospirillum japonicum]SEI51553.1 sec-independent protein translocase protein TatB [Allopseudospirillum japonicum]
MFDIGFFELLLLGLVSLLVLGPERLPHAARTAGLWVGRMRQAFSGVQQEINQQLEIEALHQRLAEQEARVAATLAKAEQAAAQVQAPPTQIANTPEAETTQASDISPSAAQDSGKPTPKGASDA